jgi:ParB/RepB/Spo0J family partition protein
MWKCYFIEMIIKEISVKDISIVQNSRTRTDKSDISLLMKDIKQNGLLHPIGVYEKDSKYLLLYGSRRLMAYKKLGYTKISANILDEPTEQELLFINTSENLHREDLKPHELGRICLILNKQGLNKKEIATRLGLTEGKVFDVIRIIQNVPRDLMDDIQNVKNTRNIAGKLATNTVSQILNVRTKPQNQVKLMKFAKVNSLTGCDIKTFDGMFRQGKDFEGALKEIKNTATKSLTISLKKKQSEVFFKKEGITFSGYVLEVLKGQRKPNTGILI